MKVYVDIHDKRWKKYKIDFEKIANAAVSGVHKDSEVSIVLVDDAEIHQINREYRNMDKPTNVLSFELGDDILLGDIYISIDTVMREATDAKISIEEHVAHMVVHGVLHLTGYDHITDDEATVMEMKEINILKKLGIKNPYQDDDTVCCNVDCCPGGRLISWLKKIKLHENSLWQYALYAVFGGITSFGFAPFNCLFAFVVGVSGAYWLTVRNKNIGGFMRNFIRVAPFGFVYSIAMFWWVLHSIYVVPEIMKQYAIWTVPGLFGLGIAGALIFSWPFVLLGQSKKEGVARPILFATVWSLVLWGREWMFTGFPWNPAANTMLQYPFVANSMSLWGTLGLTFILIALIALFVELFVQKKRKSVIKMFVFFVLLLCAGIGYGRYNMKLADVGADVTTPMIRIVQPAASQLQKATHSRADALEKAEYNLRNVLGMAAGVGNPDIIVMPETTYPYAVMSDDDIAIARILNRPVVMGATTVSREGVHNSMVVSDRFGRIQRIYNKSHLVPFGEYSPLGFMPSPANLKPGRGPIRINVDGFVFAPAICYEVIFSDSLLPDNSENLNAIINITNDNWFGNTPGVYQHLDMVRRYAIESGMPIVRANYSGISAFVASDGAIISSLPVGMSGVLDGYVWGAHDTPYRMLGLNGVMIIILLFAIVVVLCNKKKD